MPYFSFHVKTQYVCQSLRSIKKEQILKAAKKVQKYKFAVWFEDLRFVRMIKLKKKKKENVFFLCCRVPKEYLKTKQTHPWFLGIS